MLYIYVNQNVGKIKAQRDMAAAHILHFSACQEMRVYAMRAGHSPQAGSQRIGKDDR